jgi:hypothetical protein
VRASIVAGLALAGLLAGCGGGLPSLPPACSDGPERILNALAGAPGPVHLYDGTLLSRCVSSAYQDGEVQQLGFTFTPAADRLARQATPGAALRLGYLVGAVRRGAGTTNGAQLELVRRLESTVHFDDPALEQAVERGARAGEARG